MGDEEIDEEADLGRDVAGVGEHGGDGERHAPRGKDADKAALAQGGGGQEQRAERDAQALAGGFDEDLAVVGDHAAAHLHGDRPVGPRMRQVVGTAW